MTDTPTTIITFLTALQVPIATGVFGLFAVYLTNRISKGQLEVSRQTLFLSLVPRRIEWLDNFRKAVNNWERQMQINIQSVEDENIDTTALFEVISLRQESSWLLGKDIENIAKRFERALESLLDLRIKASCGEGQDKKDAMMGIGPKIAELDSLFGLLFEKIKPKLYVGDIERPSGALSNFKIICQRLLF